MPLKDKYYTGDFWYEFFMTNGYVYNGPKYKDGDPLSFQKTEGDVQVYVDFDPLTPLQSKDANLIEIHFSYIQRGIWVPLKAVFDYTTIEEALLVIKALAKPDQLPLCVGFDWAKDMVSYFLENDYASI